MQLSDYIAQNQKDAIIWKAEKLLTNLDNPIKRNERVKDIARTIALLPPEQQVVKDDYILLISKEYNINKRTLEKFVIEQTVLKKKKSAHKVRKNKVTTLDGDQRTFIFFHEITSTNAKTKDETFKGIKLDKLRFVQLLGSFGYTRYAVDSEKQGGFIFVRIQDNLIREVDPEEIKDFIEDFVRKEYDFEGAGTKFTGSDELINHFYDNMKNIFSKDLFARVRTESPIIINTDSQTECYLYFKNGFVKITKDGYDLLPYEKMDGSVWSKQLQEREFVKKEFETVIKENGEPDLEATFTNERPEGDYADFVWRISGQKKQRFFSLCSIIGYLVHDYYDYKLKCIFFTDSTVGEFSEGRTGKTLGVQLLGHVRSYCEINGKGFNPEDEKKYQYADITTQILHINDVMHKGRYRFDFECLFNDITEGYYVRHLFERPFHKRSKFVVSSNRTIAINGASMRDRIVEFEVSNFFGEHRTPFQFYGKWMGKNWDEKDWQAYDNFICFCVQIFLTHNIIPPDTINLEARKLLDTCGREFVEFMNDIADNLKSKGLPWDEYHGSELSFSKFNDIREFEFDKNKLFQRFVHLYPDYKSHFSQKRFTMFLHSYARLQIGIRKPQERRSNGVPYIKFQESKDI